MRFLILSAFLVFIVLGIKAQSGLRFCSNEVSKEQRTGVDFTAQKNISYQNSFEISADISFRNSNTNYGDILSLREISGDNMLQVSYRNPELFVVLNKSTTKIRCNISHLLRQYNRWYHFSLKVDSKKGEVTLKFGDCSMTEKMEFPLASEFSLSMGVVNKYGFFIDEVPSLSVKDFAIFTNENKEFFWPLNKTNEERIDDKISSNPAQIFNADWVINYHNKWHEIKEFNFKSRPYFAYDSIHQKIYLVLNNGEVYTYRLSSDELTIDKNVGNFPCLEENQQMVVLPDGKLLTYSFNKNNISIYDPVTKSWSLEKEFVDMDVPKFWHHNKIVNPANNRIVTLCGYGYYAYTNEFQSYNEDTRQWDTLSFSGDTISPRYLAALGASKIPYVKYLYSGIGNPQGKQILGKEFFYDFYKIDFQKQHITKIKEFKAVEPPQLLPVHSLVMDESDSSFYTLLFPALVTESYLQVVKRDIYKPSITFIGDSIPYKFIDTHSFADLFYWKKENKLVCVTLYSAQKDDNFEVHLYSINYKPENDLPEAKTQKSVILSVELAIVFLLIAFLIIKFLSRKKKNVPDSKTVDSKDDNQPIKPGTEAPHTNAILTFGGFQVYDTKGNDISYRFSPTLRELFLLILLHSQQNERGISSEKIQECLWPGKPWEKAKNNRGVNIKKLREVLVDLNGIELLFDNVHWKIVCHENVYIDLKQVNLLLQQQADNNNIDDLSQLLQLLKAGTFLNDMNNEWLDGFKDQLSASIVATLEQALNANNLSKTFISQIVDILFAFDEVNELALKAKVRSLAASGNHSLATDTYHRFCKRYFELYNSEYHLSLKQILL